MIAGTFSYYSRSLCKAHARDHWHVLYNSDVDIDFCLTYRRFVRAFESSPDGPAPQSQSDLIPHSPSQMFDDEVEDEENQTLKFDFHVEAILSERGTSVSRYDDRWHYNLASLTSTKSIRS